VKIETVLEEKAVDRTSEIYMDDRNAAISER
jgi:hypothetical protein